MTVAEGSSFDVRETNWVPLERFMQVCVNEPILDPNDFMWMGTVDISGSRRVEMYKHVGTRRYLYLDADGHAYRPVTRNSFIIHRSPADAVADLDVGPTRGQIAKASRSIA